MSSESNLHLAVEYLLGGHKYFLHIAPSLVDFISKILFVHLSYAELLDGFDN